MNDGSSLNSGETTYMEFREVGNQNTHTRAHTLKTVTDFDNRHNLMSSDRARPTAKKINLSRDIKCCIQNEVTMLVI